MNCPDCGAKYSCPCGSCISRSSTLTPSFIRVNEEEEACYNCGVVKSIWEWQDIEYKQYRKEVASERKTIRI